MKFLRERGKAKISMLTAYDFHSAKICDEAGVNIILVGDSAANVVHGFKSTKEIGMTEMLIHARAVMNAKPKAKVIVDLPYKSDSNSKLAVENAKKFLNLGIYGVKIEGNKIEQINALKENGIPVMGHLGYLPQTHEKPFVNRDEEKILEEAKEIEKAGAEWLVLEMVPKDISKAITEKLKIPTIGIGSGKYCSGQVLVFHDLVGLSDFKPKFLKQYASLKEEAINAVKNFKREVENGVYPADENSY